MAETATALIFTALGLEFSAALEHLTDVSEKTVDGVVYGVGTFLDGEDKCLVVVAQTGAGNVEAATLTERAIKQFSPRFAFFVGIAGGLKDELKLGDVVVADKVYAYEAGKAESNFKTRPKAPLTGFASLQRASATARGTAWLKRIKPQPREIPKVFVKPIAAGEKVVDSHRSDAFRLIKSAYGDAYAVAMEEFGFYYAMHLNPAVNGIVIRGISDFAHNKSTVEKEKSQEIAARNAAAFAFEMLAGFRAADAVAAHEAIDYRHL
jgi:nucleoside phosphorylase